MARRRNRSERIGHTPMMVMVTMALDTSPSASVRLYVKVSFPRYPAVGVKEKLPSALSTSVPCSGWVATVNTLPPLLLSASLVATVFDSVLPCTMLKASSWATGTSLAAKVGGGGSGGGGKNWT